RGLVYRVYNSQVERLNNRLAGRGDWGLIALAGHGLRLRTGPLEIVLDEGLGVGDQRKLGRQLCLGERLELLPDRLRASSAELAAGAARLTLCVDRALYRRVAGRVCEHAQELEVKLGLSERE